MALPQPLVYRRQGLDHVGLVAGMVDACGIREGMARSPAQTPERRLVTAGQAVKALVLTGLDVVNHQRSLGPHVFQHTPTARLMAPAVAARALHEDTLGRALDPLDAYGMTALYHLMAATAAQRLGRAPTVVHRDRTRVHVEGRDNRDEAPSAPVLHLTRGSSRDHRPALNHIMRDLMVEPQAGMPVWMKPLSGHSRGAIDFGPIGDHGAPWPTTYGPTSLNRST